jgi:hypothetical protein
VQAKPDDPVSGGCYVDGKLYPDGATVLLDPGPRSAMAAPVHVRCVRGQLCYDTVPVCVPLNDPEDSQPGLRLRR